MWKKFKGESKKSEHEELENFETLRDELQVTQMLFDSFKYGYDSNAETSEDEIGEESVTCVVLRGKEQVG